MSEKDKLLFARINKMGLFKVCCTHDVSAIKKGGGGTKFYNVSNYILR